MMDAIVIAGLSVVGIIALFVARGVYLIGTGGEAEMQARSMGTGNEVTSAGWVTLDSLRDGYVPGVSEIESWLDDRRGDDDE